MILLLPTLVLLPTAPLYVEDPYYELFPSICCYWPIEIDFSCAATITWDEVSSYII
jgi:hypothetical protein